MRINNVNDKRGGVACKVNSSEHRESTTRNRSTHLVVVPERADVCPVGRRIVAFQANAEMGGILPRLFKGLPQGTHLVRVHLQVDHPVPRENHYYTRA